MSEARDNLVRNLKRLMEITPDRDTQEKISKAAQVSIGVVNKLLNQTSPGAAEPRVDIVERIAGCFGLAAWQLVHPNLEMQRREAELYSRFRQLMRDEGVL